MKKILVMGASGFVGGHLARGLLAEKYLVRCLARTPSRVEALAHAGCEIAKGDMSDLASLQRAMDSVDAAYISIHTLSPQQGAAPGLGFMDVEMKGLQNIVSASQTQGVRRLIYVTSVGIAPDAPSAWLRERWKTEQFLLNSGLNVTVIQPGQIVGVGGRGFDMMIGQAKMRVAITMGSGEQKWRGIAINDLVYYMIGVLNEPRAYGQRYAVGCDNIMTYNQMIDVAAEVLGRPHPGKLHIPRTLLGAAAPLIERMAKLPKGAMKGLLDSQDGDGVGDAKPIRAILPRPPLPYREAVARALGQKH